MIEGRRFICGSLRDYGRRLYKPPMQYVLTVIGDPRSRPLTAALVDAARRAIDSSRSTAGAAHWLADGIACDLPFEGSEPTITQALVREAVGRVPRTEEHTSELQSLMRRSLAAFCSKKKK